MEDSVITIEDGFLMIDGKRARLIKDRYGKDCAWIVKNGKKQLKPVEHNDFRPFDKPIINEVDRDTMVLPKPKAKITAKRRGKRK